MMSLEDQELAEYWIEEIEGCIDEDDFQAEFFESLTRQFRERDHLSGRQMEALKRIYTRVTGG